MPQRWFRHASFARCSTSVSRATNANEVVGQFFQQDWSLVTSLQGATIFGAPISATFWPSHGEAFTWGATQWVTASLVVLKLMKDVR